MMSSKSGFALSLILLQSCSAVFNPQANLDPEPYFLDSKFPQVSAEFTMETPEQLFLLPDLYKRQLDQQVLTQETEYERYVKLRQWAFRRFGDFEFTTTETVSLSELNNARKINCLTFSAMFIAAARYSDVDAKVQLVFAPPYWDRNNNSWINNQHINVTGEVELPDFAIMLEDRFDTTSIPVHFADADFGSSYRYVIDINPAVVSMRTHRRVINEEQVASLFYSNKTIEELLAGNIASAYAYTKAALGSDASSSIAWNNLGVLYGRVGEHALAAESFEMAVEIDSTAHSARSNLARTYRTLGQNDLALALEEEVTRYRESNPYYLAAQGEEELEAGNYLQAREKFEEALDRKHNEQHFYHQLAIISQKLGDIDGVVENLQSARRYAKGGEKARFANKLQALESLL